MTVASGILHFNTDCLLDKWGTKYDSIVNQQKGINIIMIYSTYKIMSLFIFFVGHHLTYQSQKAKTELFIQFR
jgi:hypothetical protein